MYAYLVVKNVIKNKWEKNKLFHTFSNDKISVESYNNQL